MAQGKLSEIRFPIQGLVKRFGYQNQPPYTTCDAVNVRPFDQLEGRERGGSRPGTSKALDQNILPTAGAWIQCFAPVALVGNDAVISYRIAAIAGGKLYCSDANGDMQSVAGTLAEGLNSGALNLQAAQNGVNLYIAEFREIPLGNTDGVIDPDTGKLTAPSVAYWTDPTLDIDTDRDMVLISEVPDGLWNGYTINSCTSGALTLNWPTAYSTGKVTVTDGDVILTGGTWPDWIDGCDLVISGLGTFEVLYVIDDTELMLVDTTVNNPNTYSTGLVTVAAGVVTLNGGVWPAWVAGCNLTITRVGTYEVSTRDGDTQVTLVNTAVNSSTSNPYKIVEASTFSISPTATNCTWKIYRPIKVFDPVAPSVSHMVPSWGLMPVGCPLICTYRDRLVLAGPDHLWYMSRAGDPTDWDYGVESSDPSRAIAGTGANSGEMGQPIRALIPFADDYLVIACENALWVIKGDPGGSGTAYNLSREVGVIGPNAWTRLPDGKIVFLSRQGLYVLAPDDTPPQPFSENAVPADLLDIDTTTCTVSLCYDGSGRGIQLDVTPVDGTTGTHWWIDWIEKGIWPDAIPDGQQPTVAVSFALTEGSPRQVLLGCIDGYIRSHDDTVDDDDGMEISSYVRYGPFHPAEAGSDCMLAEIEADLDAAGPGGTAGSADVTCEVHCARTPEGAATSTTPAYTMTWVAGKNQSKYPRVRGAAICLLLSSTGKWAIERIVARFTGAGRSR